MDIRYPLQLQDVHNKTQSGCWAAPKCVRASSIFLRKRWNKAKSRQEPKIKSRYYFSIAYNKDPFIHLFIYKGFLRNFEKKSPYLQEKKS
jgi:hypothetical protein